MKEKIEDKIESHIKSILKKDAIDFNDYQILISELTRINAKEQAEKWEADKDDRNTKFKNALEALTMI